APEPVDPRTAVLSYHVWQTLFDGRPEAIGDVVWINNQPHTVVGVMPEWFWFSSMDSPIWVPLDPAALSQESGLAVVVRRAAGVTPELLAQRLRPGVSQYSETLPASERQLRLKVSALEGTPMGKAVSIVLPWLLGASVLLTLLIACANVAILVIAQWTAREHEIAIRASLGASRARIIRTLLTESVVLAAMGGLLGVCTTMALRGLIVHNAGAATAFFDLSVDPRVLVASTLITLLTAVIPAVRPPP